MSDTADAVPFDWASRAADKLARSEAGYFEAAAENHVFHGGTLSLMPRFPTLSVAAVLHSLPGTARPALWLEELEPAAARYRARCVRVYLDGDGAARAMQARGYRPSEEVGYAMPLDASVREGPELNLMVCRRASDWKIHAALCQSAQQGPDGHDMDGVRYSQAMRLKAEAGYMTQYLTLLEDVAIGFAGLSIHRGFARFKNLFLHPAHRGHGLGTLAVRALLAITRRRGARYLGAYALSGHPSNHIYRRLGLIEVHRQTEWSKPLGQS